MAPQGTPENDRRMTPERWEQVSELFGAALDCEPERREAFLAQACTGDAEIEAEVVSLLKEHDQAAGFLDAPADIGAAAALRGVLEDEPSSLEPDPYQGMMLSNRYCIEARLARGGQAVIYRARDLTLMSKIVVLKVLPGVAGQKIWLRKSFQQEKEALSRIDHPGVVGVLDTGRMPDGSPFLVMQYVQGITLRQGLAHGPLDPARAASIVRQIGSALDAIHAANIAHRDLKPENILLQRLSDGSEHVRLIDFGIAQVERSAAVGETTGGPVAGSVRYMAPEQFQGRASRASDIYALGLIICEMLAGAPEIRAVPAPGRVRASIRRALAFRPQDRPRSAGEFCDRVANALVRPRRDTWRRTAATAAASLVVLSILNWILSGTRVAPAEVHSLAILPFNMLNPSAPMESLRLGIADALITRLGSISGLIVRPVSVVRRYDIRGVDPVAAARELKVDAVVEGTLQLSGEGIRANVRLIRAADGKALWAGTIDSREGPLFAIEDAVAQEIAVRINAKLSERERSTLESRRSPTPEAYELYIKGRYEWGRRTREGLEEAADFFRGAIDLDPGYARAHVGLADCYLLLGGYGHYPFLEMLPKARALASRALALDPSLGEAHATLALVSQNLDWDWGTVEHHYRQAVALSPNYATGHHWFAEFLSILGRFEESRREFERAQLIDPISPIIQIDEAQLYFFAREYDRSLEILRRVQRTDPASELVHERIAAVYLVQGREEEAWSEIQSLGDCRLGATDCRRIWTAYLPRRGARAARRALQRLEAEAARRHIPPSVLVIAHARQGEYDRALDWLEYMLAHHEVMLITAKVNPLFDPLRFHPRFKKVLEELHLDR